MCGANPSRGPTTAQGVSLPEYVFAEAVVEANPASPVVMAAVVFRKFLRLGPELRGIMTRMFRVDDRCPIKVRRKNKRTKNAPDIVDRFCHNRCVMMCLVGEPFHNQLQGRILSPDRFDFFHCSVSCLIISIETYTPGGKDQILPYLYFHARIVYLRQLCQICFDLIRVYIFYNVVFQFDGVLCKTLNRLTRVLTGQ